MYTMYTNASDNIPLTLTLVHTWYEESTPHDKYIPLVNSTH